MDNHELVRMKSFKKTVDIDAGRRRRDETKLQIRKNKKEDQLSKRRAANSNPIGASSDTNSSIVTNGSDTDAQDEKKLSTAEELPALANTIRVSPPSATAFVEAVRGIRRMLSVEKNPPILAVIKAGVLPRIKESLLYTEDSTLQFEAAWALTNIASTQYTAEVVNVGAIDPLVLCLRSADPNVREQAGWCIGNIAGDSTDFRDRVLQAGALEPLVMNIQTPDNKSLLANIVWTISNLMRGKPQPNLSDVVGALPALAFLLSNESADVTNEMISDVCWALSYLSDGDNNRIQTVMEANVAPRLISLLESGPTAVKTPIVRTLGNFVSGEDHQTQGVIDAGVLDKVGPLLEHARRNIRKETCWLLSNIAAGTPKQINAIVEKRSVLQKILEMAQTAEYDVRKEAIWVVSNIFTGGTDDQVQLLANGGIDAMCSVLDMDDSKMVMVALDALEKALEVGEKHGRCYPQVIDECDGVDKLEALQEHGNEEIYTKVIKIIDRYFGMDEVEDENLAPEVNGDTFAFGIPSKQLFSDESPSKSGMSESATGAPLQQFNFANDFGGFHPAM